MEVAHQDRCCCGRQRDDDRGQEQVAERNVELRSEQGLHQV